MTENFRLTMSCFRLFLVIVVTLAAFESFVCHDQKFYVKSVRCNASSELVYGNFSCFAKSYSRNRSTFNVLVSFKKPYTSDLFDQPILYYRYGLIFREVMRSPRIDLCEAMASKNFNKMFDELQKFINESAPGSMHECPYSGFNMMNASFNASNLLSIWPSGEYKIVHTVYAGSTPMLTISLVAIISSELKENFG